MKRTVKISALVLAGLLVLETVGIQKPVYAEEAEQAPEEQVLTVEPEAPEKETEAPEKGTEVPEKEPEALEKEIEAPEKEIENTEKEPEVPEKEIEDTDNSGTEDGSEAEEVIREQTGTKIADDRISFEGIEYKILKAPKGKKKGKLSAECFAGKSVKKVVFPESITCEDKAYVITRIADYAFDETKVQSVALSNTITEVGAGAFAYASKLTEVVIPACEKLEIGDGAFYGCGLLSDLKLDPNAAVSSIGEASFTNTAITKIVLPESCRFIGAAAFYGCKSLKKAVLGRGVESIGQGAFKHCNAKLSLSFSGDNPYFRFSDGCLYSVEDGSLLNGDAASGNLVLPEGLTTIPAYCFEGNEALKTVVIPNTVTTLSEGMFMDCTKLTAVTLPENLSSIEAFAFYNCQKLKAVTIPKTVELIDGNPFMYCPKLSKITVEKGNTHYRAVKGMLCSYNKKTIISAPALKGEAKLYSSARYIGAFAFCGNTALKTINLNKKLKSVGLGAFYGCSNLGYVFVPNGNIDFSVDAWVVDEDDTEYCGIFHNCKNGLEINIPFDLNAGSSDSIDFFIKQHCDDNAVITQR